MTNESRNPRYPANWTVRFLCDCRKQGSKIDLHNGIARELSANGVRMLSDHHICQHKTIAMQLLIPPVLAGVPQKIVKIIGNSLTTIMREGKFLTEIEFLHFEADGLNELKKNLKLRFDPAFIP